MIISLFYELMNSGVNMENKSYPKLMINRKIGRLHKSVRRNGMEKAFVENEYPRDMHGKFAEKGDNGKKDNKVKKEPWGSSTEKAKTLKIEDFGIPDSIREQDQTVRTASNRREATEILKEIIKHGPYTSKSGLTARIPGKSIGKLVSSEAVNASFLPEAHYLAVANIDKLFSNAIEPWVFDLNPTKNNDGLKARHYLYAPMNFHKRIIVVKFTVKEYINPELPNKTYAIEAVGT
jgi:hypothetical protein